MDTIKGLIEKVTKESGVSKTTGKPFLRFVFVIDGKSYSTFDDKIGINFKAGDFVEMQGEQNGAYWNMKTMVICAQEASKQEISMSDTEVVSLLRQILAELRTIRQ